MSIRRKVIEASFVENIKPHTRSIGKEYYRSTNLDIAPLKVKTWSNMCGVLIGTIQEFTLFYSEHGMNKRTPENRKACMSLAIQRYHQDLERYKQTPIYEE